MKLRTLLVLAFSLGLGPASVLVSTQSDRGQAAAREQRVLPPEARYWMGATTLSGLLGMGGVPQGGRRGAATQELGPTAFRTEGHAVALRLGSTLAPKGSPEATHTMPAGAQVNQPIFLSSPEASSRGNDSPAPYQQPKGQITFYWGCGATIGPGQPLVLTFDKLTRGENAPEIEALQSAVSAREVAKPTSSTSKTYGEWPHADPTGKNRQLRAVFPAGSTLAGQHVINATYSPIIDFTLPTDKSFMAGVQYTSSAVQSGALPLNWGAVPRATGYSVGIMTPDRAGDDSTNMIMWSSADRPATWVQMEDLTRAEVDRLIGLKAVLPPTTTSCTIPTEVLKATKEGSMLMFTAFGDEATFVAPARPADPGTTWDQEWFSRVTFKSTRMDMITPSGVQDMAAMMGGRSGAAASPSGAQSDEEYCKELDRQKQAARGGIGGAIGSRLGRFGRAMGRGKQDDEPVDPRCGKK